MKVTEKGHAGNHLGGGAPRTGLLVTSVVGTKGERVKGSPGFSLNFLTHSDAIYSKTEKLGAS